MRFQALSVYDLGPEALGEFDVVVCGSLLLHLRDPLRALAAIRSVCAGELLCTNQVDLRRSLWAPRSPLIRLDGTSGITQWWLPNAAGHRQMLRAAGFAIERQSRLYSIPYGPAHPCRRGAAVAGAQRGSPLADRQRGVAHHAVLARRANGARAARLGVKRRGLIAAVLLVDGLVGAARRRLPPGGSRRRI